MEMPVVATKGGMPHAIFGAAPYQGNIKIAGQAVKIREPHDAIGHSMALITEDRKAEGLFLQQSVTTNVTISGLKQLCQVWVIQKAKELQLVQDFIKQLRIKTPGASSIVRNMSGGNQQKAILARWMSIGIRVLMLDEPTRGIDVGSKQESYQLMAQLAEQGVGMIMISSTY